MPIYKKEKQKLFSETSKSTIQILLEENPQTDLIALKGPKNNSVLHQCAFQKDLAKMKLYLQVTKNKLKKEGDSQELIEKKIISWINCQNEQGFSPIHYASYQGSIQIIKLLKAYKADLSIQTTSGLNIMHLAAQGDRVKVFAFLQNEVPINQVDQKNSTTLHWAAYIGSEHVTRFLLAQKETEINLQDHKMQTPLHLATAYGNTKIVQRLLVAGADRHIKNQNGKTALDIAIQNQFHSLKNMLNDQYTLSDYCKFFMNIKRKYEPQSRSYKMPIMFFITSLIYSFTLFYLPKPQGKYWIPIYAVQGLFCLIMVIFYTVLIRPPRIQEKGSYDLILTGDEANLKNFCFQCRRWKNKKAFHCDICKTCINRYDHHCPWINNCTGVSNIKFYLPFLIMLQIFFTWFLIFAGLMCYKLSRPQFLDDIVNIRPPFDQKYNFVVYILLSLCGVVAIFFLVPLFMLIWMQSKNLLLNRTTYQRFNARKPTFSKNAVSFHRNIQAQNEEMSCSNCRLMCCPNPEETEPLNHGSLSSTRSRTLREKPIL